MIRYLPWLFLLACPLMMMFMMLGRGGGGRTTGLGKRPRGSTDIPLDAIRGQDRGDEPGGGDSQARIAQLQREVDQLRTVRDRDRSDIPVRR